MSFSSATTLPGRTRGVTLGEAFMLVTALLMLGAVVFPVLRTADQRDKLTDCVSHEKALAQAITLYTQSHEGQLPASASWATAITVKDAANFDCPASTSRGTAAAPDYGYGWWLDGKKLANVPQPAATVLLADNTSALLGGTLTADARHDGQATFAFADGHVATMKPSELEHFYATDFSSPAAFPTMAGVYANNGPGYNANFQEVKHGMWLVGAVVPKEDLKGDVSQVTLKDKTFTSAVPLYFFFRDMMPDPGPGTTSHPDIQVDMSSFRMEVQSQSVAADGSMNLPGLMLNNNFCTGTMNPILHGSTAGYPYAVWAVANDGKPVQEYPGVIFPDPNADMANRVASAWYAYRITAEGPADKPIMSFQIRRSEPTPYDSGVAKVPTEKIGISKLTAVMLPAGGIYRNLAMWW
ncbi:MAG TPA: hypothetical protein VGL77_19715 [Armatimonadota bacterium]|jgi:prepilin-type processing-associated H-X9-DG protein